MFPEKAGCWYGSRFFCKMMGDGVTMENRTFWKKKLIVFIIFTVACVLLMTVGAIAYAVKYRNTFPHVEATIVSEVRNRKTKSYTYTLSYEYHNEEYTGRISTKHRILDTEQTLEVAIDPKDPYWVMNTPMEQSVMILAVLFFAAIADITWVVERNKETEKLVGISKICLGIHIFNAVLAVVLFFAK